MITHEEYLKAKAIVEEYEEQEYGKFSLDESEEEDIVALYFEAVRESTCEECGGTNYSHFRGCTHNDDPFGR